MINKTITLMLAITLMSCASRKAEVKKDEVKEVAKVEIKQKETTIETKATDVNIKETKTIEVDKVNNIVTEIETIEPIDPKQKSNYKGKEFQNAKIVNRITTDLSNENLRYKLDYHKTKKELVSLKKELDTYKKMYNEIKSKSKSKEVTTDNKVIYIFLFIILILLFLAFLVWSRKYINKITK